MKTSLQTYWSRIRPGRTLFLTKPQGPRPWGGLGSLAGWRMSLGLAIFLLLSGLSNAQDGSNDPTFNPTDVGFNNGSGPNSTVRSMAVQADGKILMVGGFTSYNGTGRNFIARLNANGSLDTDFNPGAGPNNYVQSVAVQADGKILIGGDFTSYNGTSRNRIARLNADGTLDADFNPSTGASSIVQSVAVQTDGKILIGGRFTSYNGTGRGGIARLNADGSPDTGFNSGAGTNSSVNSVAVQADGKILIGGTFTSYNGTDRAGIARLNANGSLDTDFNPGTGANSSVESVAVQADGKILIGGGFTFYNGTGRNRIARLKTDGTLDTDFDPGAGTTSIVLSVAVQGDGKILIGGSFTQYNGTGRNYIARLNANGSLDTDFNPGTGANNGTVYSIAVQGDGKVLIGGGFSTYNNTGRFRIARLNTDGTLDPGFNLNTGTDDNILSVAVQADGKILIGGFFTKYNNVGRNSIARLNINGSLDTGFDPGTGAGGTGSNAVRSVVVQGNGKILIGGTFTAYNGTGRNRIARLVPRSLTLTGFVANPATVCVGSVASFTATVDNLTGSYSYTLTTGTSSTTGTATSATFSQTLVAGGTGPQTVTLTVSSGNQLATASTPLTVNAPPVATLTSTPSATLSCGQTSLTLTAGGGTGYIFSGPGILSRSGNQAVINAPGSYSVSVTNAGCPSSSTTSIAISQDNASPAASLASSGGLSGAVTSVTLTANAGSGLSYLFSSGATQIGSGPTATVSTAGIYSVTVVSSNGCSAVASTMVTSDEPVITALSPTRNARNALATTNVAITFDQSISSGIATLGAVRVFSQQRGGLLRNGQGGSTSVSGNTLTFDPTTNFRPGETILTTVTSQVQNSGGASLARGQVHQFTVGVGGTGVGHFTDHPINPNPAVGSQPRSVAMGDVDGDGDLDLLTANYGSNTVSVRLNDGSGNFTDHPTNPDLTVGDSPQSVALGDVDGDGDLDLLTANYGSNTVSLQLNDGSGNFTDHPTNPALAVGDSPQSVALGDVDVDGDLDLLTANANSANVSVLLNDGSGNFTPPATNPNPTVGDSPQSVALGDVDGDGDLDLLTANIGNNNVSVRFNDGSGNFTAPATNPDPAVGNGPRNVMLGDIDGDGDLDLLTANLYGDNISVLLNDGSGNFTDHPTNPNLPVGSSPYSVVLGDVDGDGDLDLLTANPGNNNVSVLLNDGLGNFTDQPTNPNPAVGNGPVSVAVGDVDGDGDLDLLTANISSDNVSVLLNQSLDVAPTIIGFNALENPVCESSPLTFTATVGNLSPPYAFTLSNGSSTTLGSAASTTFSQVLTASGSGMQTFTLTVSSQGQVVTATTSVTVNALPVAGLVANGPLSCSQPSVTLTASGGGTYQFSNGARQINGGNTATVSTAGVYSVTVTSANGCTATASTSIGFTNDLVATAGASSSTAPVGSVVSLTASGGSTYQWLAPPGTLLSSPATSSLVSATLTASGPKTFTVIVSQGSCSQNLTVDVTATLPPDLIPLLYVTPSLAYNTTTGSVVVDVFEINSTPTSGTIRVHISKSSLLSLSFDPGATGFLGHPVQNSVWTFDGTSNSNAYTLTTTQVIGAGSRLSVGLSSTLTPGQTRGRLSITATLVGGSGGEMTLTNNTDADQLEYFNK